MDPTSMSLSLFILSGLQALTFSWIHFVSNGDPYRSEKNVAHQNSIVDVRKIRMALTPTFPLRLIRFLPSTPRGSAIS